MVLLLGSSRQVLVEGTGGKEKKRNEPSTHLSECAAGGSDAGMPDFRCVFTLFKGGF